MRRQASVPLAALALALALALGSNALGASGRVTLLPLPHWLVAAQKQALDRVFGGTVPIHTFYVSYANQIAVIFDFRRIVICHTCSGPNNAAIPRGRVIRVSFNRKTHRLNGSMQFCESHGSLPRRSLCLHR
jgi:hypothetical protein